MNWPRIVAEALRQVPHPAYVAVERLAEVSLQTAADGIAAATRPARSSDAPPAFLYPQQHDAWRRIMATLRGWGGAVSLEPVGTGKTWIALAVAAREAGEIVAVVPSIVRSQWRVAATRAGVDLQLWTHERASRGTLPPGNPTLVIIDEAHRLRDPASKRTLTLAPWLVGRRVLLLTATPIVNRISDFIALLRLAVPEDALSLDGIPHLGMMDGMAPPPALRRVAVRSVRHAAATIGRNSVVMRADTLEEARCTRAVVSVSTLRLSDNGSIRRLIASVLLDAAASSDAAFHQALRRYRALLLQARDAGGASRAMLRRFAGDSLEQLVFWPLIDRDITPGELPVADIDRVERLLSAPEDDAGWLEALVAKCCDLLPTICFTRHRATARRLRIALGDGTAWIMGSDAGIGDHRMPRQLVLDAFGPGRGQWRARSRLPRLLVTTDVAAEGLDLHAAGRIVHVDFPWTATRVDQREGRLLRLGQLHGRVEVVARLPAFAIERAIEPAARVDRKRQLSDVWLEALTIDDAAEPAVVRPGPLRAAAEANDDPGVRYAVRLEQGGRVGVMFIPGPVSPDVAAGMATAMRNAVAAARPDDTGSRALVSRVHRLARPAALARNGAALRRLDRLLRFATSSTTLGGRMLSARLAELSDRELIAADVPDIAKPDGIMATVIAAITFRSPDASLR